MGADSLARIDALTEAGRKAAEVLRNGGFQLEAAFAAGISEKSYYRYLEGEDEASMAFQRQVLPALFEQARKAEEQAERDVFGGEQHSNAAVSWHKWKLEKRYRKLFGDLAQKHEVEVSGKNGGPIKTESVVYAAALTPAEQLERLRELADAGDEEAIALLEAAKKVG